MNTPSREPAGFTLPELLVVVVVLGLGIIATVDVSTKILRREQINAVAIGLSGWLEEVRRSALKGNPCAVSIPEDSGGAGATIATAEEVPRSGEAARTDRCQARLPFTLPTDLNNDRVAVSPAQDFSFGTLGTMSPADDKEIILTLSTASGQVQARRCVRLRGMLGFVEVGNHNGSGCTYATRY
jgi:prepilin-type N-terminal cleavage/methylation domain-containing protein